MISIRGIILDYIKWKESSIILRVYTDNHGLKSYIVNSVFKKTPKYNPVFFNPMNILDLVVYNKNKSINYVRDIKELLLYNQEPFDPLKLIVSHFISELVTLGIRENMLHRQLFYFLESHVRRIDIATKDNVLLEMTIFMIHFCSYVGYGLNEAEQLNKFNCNQPLLDKNQLVFIDKLLNLDFEEDNLPNIEYLKIIDKVLDFLQHHIDTYKYIKSSKVLSSYISIPS